MVETDVDVVVIGSGVAGLAAAITAAQVGASVVVAESETEVGGSSRLAAGMLMGAGTRFQRAAGIEDDSPERLFAEYMALNRWDLEAGLVQRLCEECGPAIEWLAKLGLEFFDELSYCGDESRPRMHLPRGLGQAVIDVCHGRARELGVQIALGRRVDRLLVDEAGRVAGVAAGDDELTSRAVVVAAGGFGANEAKLARWFPAATRAADWRWYMGGDCARGDALDLAEQIGAGITGHGRGLCLLTPGFVREYEPYLPGWLMMVDDHGRRFCNETAPYGILAGLVGSRGGRAFVVFDESSRLAAPVDRPAAYKQSNPAMPGRRSPNWNDEMLARMADAGRIVRAGTLEEIATGIGASAPVLTATIERYNELIGLGDDVDHHKDARFLRPISTPPFYAAEVRLGTVALTSVGLRIDRDAAVLDDIGRPIPGLFAAGECTGGVLGDIYMGSGNSYSNCLVYGRVAGTSASTSALRPS